MPAPHTSGQFGDLLDPRFQEIFREEFDRPDSMIPEIYTMVGTNGRVDMRYSSVGTLPDWTPFNGTVDYVSSNQGYNTTATPLEFASGIQIERKLFDDDQYEIMESRPRILGMTASRTREKHGARLFNNAFSIDSLFYVNSEGVPLCSDSHTTTVAGVSTASGFDNKGTSPLSATAVAATRIAMQYFRDDQAELLNVVPDEIIIPIDLYEVAYEIVNSLGKVDTALNNRNVHNGVYTVKQWNFLTDSNNWFMTDSRLRGQCVKWTDRVPMEFAMAEDLDTMVAKWRGYMRYAPFQHEWRWVFGHSVS